MLIHNFIVIKLLIKVPGSTSVSPSMPPYFNYQQLSKVCHLNWMLSLKHQANTFDIWDASWPTQALYSAITTLTKFCPLHTILTVIIWDYWVAFLTFFLVFFSFLSPSILERRNWANWSWNFIASAAETTVLIFLCLVLARTKQLYSSGSGSGVTFDILPFFNLLGLG